MGIIAQIDIIVKSIEGERLSHESKEDSSVTYDVRATISETERNPELLAVRFEIALEAQPQIAKLSVTGSAIIKGETEEIQTLTIASDGSGIPPLFMKIYQKIYPTTYLLCGSLRIPYPAPGLLRKTEVKTNREITNQIQGESKPP